MNSPKFLTHTKSPALLTALMFTGVSLTAIHTIPNPPLFQNTDNFVLFADQSIAFEENAVISSGDLGTNKTLDVGKDTTINGNLFADTITIDKNTSINGNASFNTLKNQGEILGTKTTPVSLPIANLPTISPFTVGTEDQTIQGTATLPAGNYRDLLLKKNAKLTLSGGTYNLRKFEMEENAVLVFTAPTVLNIQSKLKGKDNVSILNGANAKHDDLRINYLGAKEKDTDDDDEDRKEMKDGKSGRPISFGKNSFLNFALLAPNASVTIGKDSILRGQILARKIRAGKNFIGSRGAAFEKESDAGKVVTDIRGVQFIGNEVIVLFDDTATFANAQDVATLVGGTITGFDPNPPTYKIQIPTSDVSGMEIAIQKIMVSNNPRVIEVIPNFITLSL